MTFTSRSKTDQPKFRRSGQRTTRPKWEALDPFSSQTCSSCPQREPKHTTSKHSDGKFLFTLFFVGLLRFSARLWNSWSAVSISADHSSSSSSSVRSATCDWNQSWKPAWILQVNSSGAVSTADASCRCIHLRRCSHEVNTESAWSPQMTRQAVCYCSYCLAWLSGINICYYI